MTVIKHFFASTFHRLGYAFITLSKRIRLIESQTGQTLEKQELKSKRIIGNETGRSLYETPEGIKLWLSNESLIDDAIINEGIWEESSTNLIKGLVHPGSVALDVGANIGYYTSLISKLVGPGGHVHAFEPTRFFGTVLTRNIKENDFQNVTIHDFGLSDKENDLKIHIDGSTASIHMATGDRDTTVEVAHFVPLDQIAKSLQLEKLDFIKIDVDGHEPKFLKGAEATLRKYRPSILLEINHLDYLEAGVTAWDFYDYVRSLNFHIYNVDTLKEITTKTDFLKQCGNFGWQVRTDIAFSRNILLTHCRLDH